MLNGVRGWGIARIGEAVAPAFVRITQSATDLALRSGEELSTARLFGFRPVAVLAECQHR